MRGAVASSSVLKTTASLRNGPIRCSGIAGIAPLSNVSARTRGDSLTVLVGTSPAPAGWATRSIARSPTLTNISICPG